MAKKGRKPRKTKATSAAPAATSTTAVNTSWETKVAENFRGYCRLAKPDKNYKGYSDALSRVLGNMVDNHDIKVRDLNSYDENYWQEVKNIFEDPSKSYLADDKPSNSFRYALPLMIDFVKEITKKKKNGDDISAWFDSFPPEPPKPDSSGKTKGSKSKIIVATSSKKPIDIKKMGLNIILYGPPGTGKTYSTKRYSVELCNGTAPADDADVFKEYNTLKANHRIGFVTFHQSFGYEEFIEGIRSDVDPSGNIIYKPEAGVFKEFCDNARKYPENKYVFIIDEINRGNIAKIFGELITLIEETKREGMPEQESTILPYSKTSFSIPKNVYILGTMNTADRSITQIDTALRRRFSFVEKMPDYTLLNKLVSTEKIDVKNLLAVMNARISILFDREHQIGHSFFMGLKSKKTFNIDDLNNIFENKIIPLLKEYFYDDYEKIQIVLGETNKEDANNFIIGQKVSTVLFGDKIDKDDLPEYVYEVNFNNIDAESYEKIYK